ncbi:MAG: nitric oxide reductase activation protein [Betaproteobacteria bacterium]|nr:nitric oxide reductase activation protein [Betaproteobacteria bacterium]
MSELTPLTAQDIARALEEWLEVEFTFLQVDELASAIAELSRHDQDFLLNWTRRISTTNIEIAYQFARRALSRLGLVDRRILEAWALHAMDTYDSAGLRPALGIIQQDPFAGHAHEQAAGALFDEVRGILLTFVRGLSGRPLKIAQGEVPYTDTETLFLPPVVAQLPSLKDNFALCKATATFLWAQTRFGSFRSGLASIFAAFPDPAHAASRFHALESLRLEACIARELPGLFRDIQRLNAALAHESLPASWASYREALSKPTARAEDTLGLLASAYDAPALPLAFYHGQLRLEAVEQAMSQRMQREKVWLRVKLAELADELRPAHPPEERSPAQFAVTQTDDGTGLAQMELTLDGAPLAPPEGVRQLLTSIHLDLGGIPADYLTPAGPGEYDLQQWQERTKDPDDVWQGTYHEEGATLYREWDFRRQHYRKNWCVMREKDVLPVDDGFAAQVLQKYSGFVSRLRQSFEMMRDEDRLFKRQPDGDDVDIDALVEALADARDGREMSECLFTRMHRAERNIAVMFMIDMSGSTKGWINEAEREALVLLCEALETLGDRYAIYGFSGTTRKRCELYRIKRLDEPYSQEVRARISGIRPQDYTRMGFAIRHLTELLAATDARTKLLVTLSDGKPDDYFDGYRGAYGIEDTRQALFEARRNGIHTFCVTIDQEAQDYLPHMYGRSNFVLINEVRQLPLKVADIYRRLTT